MKTMLVVFLLLASSKSFSEGYNDVKLGMCGPIEGMYDYLQESGYELLSSSLGVISYPDKKVSWLFRPRLERVEAKVGKLRSEGWDPVFWTFTDLLVVIHQDATAKQKGSVCIAENTVTLRKDEIKDLNEYFGKLNEILN